MLDRDGGMLGVCDLLPGGAGARCQARHAALVIGGEGRQHAVASRRQLLDRFDRA